MNQIFYSFCLDWRFNSCPSRSVQRISLVIFFCLQDLTCPKRSFNLNQQHQGRRARLWNWPVHMMPGLYIMCYIGTKGLPEGRWFSSFPSTQIQKPMQCRVNILWISRKQLKLSGSSYHYHIWKTATYFSCLREGLTKSPELNLRQITSSHILREASNLTQTFVSSWWLKCVR